MTGSNKILTVSYGTFSCTLEGFDDPFGAMRGIAEYIRDLAADDRYFGAEPPTPDVEMLQNIAQKEVPRRVEARVGDAGIALRQVTEAADAPAALAAAAPDLQAESAPEPKTEATPELQIELLDSGPLAFDDEYLMADEPEDVLTVDNDLPPAKEKAPAETVAEKLRRIRAVVSKSLEAEEPHEPFSPAPAEADDTGADAEEAQKRSRALTATIASIAADLADEFESDEEEAEPEEEDAAPDRSSATDPAIAGSEDEDNLTEAADKTDDAADLDQFAISNILSDTADEDIDQDEIVADNAFETIAEQAEADDVKDIPNDEIAATDASDDDIEVSEEDDAAIVASVGKIVASGTDTEDDQAEANAAEDADDATDEEPERRTSAPLAPIHDGNGDVGRLLKETDQKLNDDDGIRRRRVISQMRAAVAATNADRIFTRIVSREASDAEDQSPYRSDLDRVISHQPTDEFSEQDAKATRPAPLVLVSSQRVDTDEKTAAKISIQPQRVEKNAEDFEEAASFKDFANRMGATELPDLLEAAAAYSAFIEGEPHFSRPEIMKRVARVDPALKLSREAGLRSFGQLLRQGKIQKLQRGQFTIGEDTRFNPAARIAGE